jgi:hypothetical protein
MAASTATQPQDRAQYAPVPAVMQQLGHIVYQIGLCAILPVMTQCHSGSDLVREGIALLRSLLTHAMHDAGISGASSRQRECRPPAQLWYRSRRQVESKALIGRCSRLQQRKDYHDICSKISLLDL